MNIQDYEDEIDQYYNWWLAAKAKLDKQAAEIERLRAALRPFAARTNSEDYIKTGPDNGLCAAMSYEVGHYREARAALEASNG